MCCPKLGQHTFYETNLIIQKAHCPNFGHTFLQIFIIFKMCIVLNKDNTHFYKKIKFIKLCIVLNQDNTHLKFFCQNVYCPKTG